jgi:hypothetical protein
MAIMYVAAAGGIALQRSGEIPPTSPPGDPVAAWVGAPVNVYILLTLGAVTLVLGMIAIVGRPWAVRAIWWFNVGATIVTIAQVPIWPYTVLPIVLASVELRRSRVAVAQATPPS